MMDYETLILPVLQKHRENTTHDLIVDLCKLESPWIVKGNMWGDTLFYVEEPVRGSDKPYTRHYGSYHSTSLLNAMKADKVEIVKYAGKSELIVVLHYYFSNQHTKLFIQEGCRVDRHPALFK